jgi:hypothetical protein
MIEGLRRAFNAAWVPDHYTAYKARLEAEAGAPIGFRVCETPVFLPPALRDSMVGASLEIWDQLQQPERLERSKEAVPPSVRAAGDDDGPLFAQADFAVVQDEAGRLAPRLIELQAFPSLYAFQFLQGRLCRSMPGVGGRLAFLLGGLDDEGYLRLVGDAIRGAWPAENVVLLDLDPPSQGTYPDFSATERLFGVRAVCPTRLERRGRELFYDRDGRRTRIQRIYNRLIVDELVAKGVRLPFSFSEPLDVEWAGHPSWFFRWSKHSLPSLRHPLVPECHLLSDLASPPGDLGEWVLKPLFSFSGSGVRLDVAPADLAAVPPALRSQTLLMRKVDYAPLVESTEGERSRLEVRIMFVWDSGHPRPVTTLARLSRGRMMGVRYNRDQTWVGSTSCLWPTETSP